MQNLKILNSRQRKGILDLLKKQYNADLKAIASKTVMLLSPKSKIFLLSRDFAKIDDKKLRIDAAGMYFGEMKRDEIRLSIEGSQIIGPMARKNAVEIDDEEAMLWMAGNDIGKDVKAEGFVIIRNKNRETGKFDYLGSGRYKEGKVLNYVPKARRVLV